MKLVERFQRNLDVYKRPDYKETPVRVEFIDPFFAALGWDVHNVQGYAEQYKDVVHEAVLKTGGTTQAPDYSFRIGGVRKFFLEAKKPAIEVKGDVGPAY
jgi:predicted type IV restriction endonuclease